MFSCCNHLLPSAFDNLFTSGSLGHGGGGVVVGEGGLGVSHVARLNFKTSLVDVNIKWLTSLPEIEREFFVFVRILQTGDSNAV